MDKIRLEISLKECKSFNQALGKEPSLYYTLYLVSNHMYCRHSQTLSRTQITLRVLVINV